MDHNDFSNRIKLITDIVKRIRPHLHFLVAECAFIHEPLSELFSQVDALYDTYHEEQFLTMEHKRGEEALPASEEFIRFTEAQLADMQRLQHVSSQLIQEENTDALYGQILDAAVTMLHADMGSLQTFHPERNALHLLAWRGFAPESAAFWEWVDTSSNTSCGTSLGTGKRSIISDTEAQNYDTDNDDLHFFRLYSIKSVQSTPLISRKGYIVGMISTHWRESYTPSERELHLLDILARQAADLIERKQTEDTLRRSEERQSFLLKLSDTLRPLADPVQIQAEASRLLGEHLGTDRAYYVEIDRKRGEFIVARDWHRPGATSHARRYPLDDWPMPWLDNGKTWVVNDVDTDPAMPSEQRERYRGNQIGACIVVPLIKNGQLAATLVTNHRTPRSWTPDEVTLMEETAERTWAAVERARAEEALRESEERFRRALEIETVGVIFLDPEGPILRANNAFLRMSGYTREDFEAGRLRWDVLTPPEWMPVSLKAIEELKTKGQTTPYEKEYYRKDGSRWWALFAATRLSEQEGVEFIIDISRQKETEVRLQELAVLEERQQLARELHDAVSQNLFTASLMIEAIPQLWEHHPQELPQLFIELSRLVKGAQAEMRWLLMELRPTNLQETPFSHLLEQRVASIRGRSQAEIHLTFDGEPVLPLEVHLAVYRIVQEALNNIRKHAQATEIGVTGKGKDGFIELHIRDNGVGFPVDAPPSTGLGLQMMRERAGEIGASLEIRSDQGTEIHVLWSRSESSASYLTTGLTDGK